MHIGLSLALPRDVGSGPYSPTLDMTLTAGLDPRITFTRASSATYFNSSGVLTTAGNNEARFDYDPATLAPRGLLIEEQRVNSIRNNTMQGAVAGTPGTAPTNWSMQTTGSGLTRTIVGVGTENGITYIDVRYAGTTTGALSSAILANNEQTTQIAAASGQSWTGSWYLSVAGGSLTGLTLLNIQLTERDAAGALLASSTANVLSTITSANLATQRFVVSRTFNNASTAFATCEVRFSVPISTAVDFTLRIGLPQLELGAFATSVIPTTTTALTRNADSASMTGTNFSSWYNATEGTFFTESQILYSTGGTFFPGVLSANNGTSTNQILTYYINTNRQTLYVRTGGTVVADIGPTASANIVFKFAGAYKENDFAATTNGAAVSTDTAGTLPPAADRLNIGSQAGLSQPLNGHIRRISYYPRRLSNTELQAITA